MCVNRISVFDILVDALLFLFPAASVSSGSLSKYLWIVLGVDVFVLLASSVYFLFKKKGKMEIGQILKSNKAETALMFTSGAVIWMLGSDWTAAIIWGIIALLLFLSQFIGKNKLFK